MAAMNKILSSFSIGKYRVLKLSAMPEKPYSHIKIGEEKFAPVPIYDMENCVAIVSNRDFTDSTIEFI